MMLRNYCTGLLSTSVVCHAFSGHCVLTVNFLKHIAVLGEGLVRFSVFDISEESLVVITFEKNTKWLTG